MSTTVKIYPETTAHQYWRGTSWTQSSPYTRSFAGVASATYLWPIPFDLSAYADKIFSSLTLHIKFSSASNTFAGGDYLEAGVSATNNNAADAADATSLDTLLPVDDQWCEFDVSDAWDTLKTGTGYLVISGNEYAVLYNNYGTVSESDRPYLELIYDDGTVGYGTGGSYDICNVYYGTGGSWVLCKPYYGYGGAWVEISTS